MEGAKYLEQGQVGAHSNTVVLNNADFDQGGREKRTGTVVTASAHIITAVVGSGVLSLAWADAQLGWVAGTAVLLAFAVITYFTSALLADCYRSPDPVTGQRNSTYSQVVAAYLGGRKVQLCGVAQYVTLVGITIGYTITSSISMVAIKRSNCFHKMGHNVECQTSNNPYMIAFACIQIMLSQIPNFDKLSGLSIFATVMSFAYSAIGLGLSVAKVVGGRMHLRTGLTGVKVGVDVSGVEKVWRSFQAIGDIAFSYAYATILIEIQDTLKSSPPENKEMKKASLIGVSTTTFFYLLCGLLGYAAFGNSAPGNLLTGFGFYEPFWLVDFANVCIPVHIIAAYQVFCQPIFSFVEGWSKNTWPQNSFIMSHYPMNVPCLGVYNLNLFRLVWRTVYVVFTSLVAMIFPFFNDFLGLIGAASYWPLTVYFPIEMHIAQNKVPKYSTRWVWLKILTYACLLVSLAAGVGSIQGLVTALTHYKPFQTVN